MSQSSAQFLTELSFLYYEFFIRNIIWKYYHSPSLWPPPRPLFFPIFLMALCRETVYILMKFNLLIFFKNMLLVSYIRCFNLICGHKDFSIIFPPRSIIVLALEFRSMISFELLFGVWFKVNVKILFSCSLPLFSFSSFSPTPSSPPDLTRQPCFSGDIILTKLWGYRKKQEEWKEPQALTPGRFLLFLPGVQHFYE